MPVHVIIDYEDISCPIGIYNGIQTELPMLQNQNGEADYNVWYHCMLSTSSHIIVLGSDTDIWVYGMAFLEYGWINNKEVHIEKSIGSEYAHLNAFLAAASSHPKLKAIRYPLSSLVAIYVLTGCDYISSLFRTSKQTFIKTFIDNIIQHICPEAIFVETELCSTVAGMEGLQLNKDKFGDMD